MKRASVGNSNQDGSEGDERPVKKIVGPTKFRAIKKEFASGETEELFLVDTEEEIVEHEVNESLEHVEEEEEEDEDHIDGTDPSQTPKKIRMMIKSEGLKHPRVFSHKWYEIPGVGEWIHPMNSDPTFVWCKYCRKKIRAHLSDMKVHSKTKKHQRNQESFAPHYPDETDYGYNPAEITISFPTPNKDSGHNDTVDADSPPPRNHSKDGLNPARIGFVGAGNMSQALLNGFIKKGLVDPANVIVSAPTDRNIMSIRKLGVRTSRSNSAVIQQSDMVFLVLSPHELREVITDLGHLEDHNPLFVSIVDGYTIQKLEELLSSVVENPRVIRAMPNTSCTVFQGCCVYSLGKRATSPEGQVIGSMLGAVGMCVQVPEKDIDSICGLAGSGPAFIYTAIEALSDGAVKMGLSRQLASQIAAQMVKGAAMMVLETGKHPAVLRDDVCSPGGTTIAGMHQIEKGGLRNTLMSAVEASVLRAKELSKAD